MIAAVAVLLSLIVGDLLGTGEPKGTKTYLLDVPGRFQYDNNGGFCGELCIQMLMMQYGAWIPQEAARLAGHKTLKSELLPGEKSYNKALRKLKVSFEEWDGKGYPEFITWAKGWLMKGVGVVEVVYIRGGQFSEYDHIIPIIGFKTSTTKYSEKDTIYVHTNYATRPVARKVGDYWCTAKNKKDGYEKGGCVPQNTRWGHAIKGPVYAGIGPPVSLRVQLSSEPGLGKSTTFRGKLTIRELQPGKQYALYHLTDLADVPSSRNATINAKPLTAFVAAKDTETMDVTFASNKVSYFICTLSS